jgi:hypothetical protein
MESNDKKKEEFFEHLANDIVSKLHISEDRLKAFVKRWEQKKKKDLVNFLENSKN